MNDAPHPLARDLLKLAPRIRRRVNGFGLVEPGGSLVTHSIDRYKVGCVTAAREALGAETWAELGRRGYRLARVQVLVLEEVAARHGNTGKRRRPRPPAAPPPAGDGETADTILARVYRPRDLPGQGQFWND